MAGNRIFVALVRRCGVRWAYVLLPVVALFYLASDSSARAASRGYQRRLFGRRGFFAETAWAYRHFYSFGQILLDRVAIAADEGERFQFAFEGEEHIRSALEAGKGAVLVTAHCGNWEAAGRLLSRVSARVNVVALEADEERLRQYFERVTDTGRLAIIPADKPAEAAISVLAALARGELVAMQADRSLDAQEEAIPFLGEPARFPVGPFAAAAVRGAPLIHAFAMRVRTYRYHFRAYPPEHPAFGDRTDRTPMLREWMGRFVRRLEETVRQYPLQWHNFYDFWERKEKA